MGDAREADFRLSLSGEDNIVQARHFAREIAKSLGFGLVDQSRIATAVSELTRNVIRYATGGRGEITFRTIDSAQATGIEIVVADSGPGIANINQAVQAGYTWARGMGLGLSGTRRLMDEMEIDSALGRGTTVTIRKWRR